MKRNDKIHDISSRLYELDNGTITVLHRILCGKREVMYGKGIQGEDFKGVKKSRFKKVKMHL